jgi:hypothetical protein
VPSPDEGSAQAVDVFIGYQRKLSAQQDTGDHETSSEKVIPIGPWDAKRSAPLLKARLWLRVARNEPLVAGSKATKGPAGPEHERSECEGG